METEVPFYLLAVATLAAAVLAISRRNIVHGALFAAAAFAGLAGIYLCLDADYVGFAQLLVYVGAVAVLILFTVLLTKGADMGPGIAGCSPGWKWGGILALVLAFCLIAPVVAGPSLNRAPDAKVTAPVREIGAQLTGPCVPALEAAGLLLTVGLIGAVVLAMSDPPGANARRPQPVAVRKPGEEFISP